MRCLLFNRKKADLKQNPVLATRHLNSELDCLVAARNDGAQSGFTLLELLVVIALLIIVSGVALMAYEGVQDQGRYDTAKFEMVEIRKALLQFRRDSGTNDFLGQGIYACEDPDSPGNLNPNLDKIPVSDLDWCEHPANFWMLFKQPGTSFDWNPDTKRGWKGPYLQRIDNVSDVDADILNTGAVASESGTEILDLWTILDPAGSPYFIFDLDNADEVPPEDHPARLVGLSQNALYDGDTTSDCTETTGSDGFPVDLILCLVR
ncbi:type II secretion system protein [Methylophaga sp. OBS4]|uniref:type II secretion system protein n=1 Tax=Methylophaga sp. OBS4 TaxID=2991935 RepID=UPI00224FA12F|nr:type II secretion system protein [Methylophaga sp. OBS4]MCX4187780.1 type II secretion system GspH family protein [Methylophaga sp. OBS4]